jgi:phosphatidylserine/phosphatidylglycerophosphate/cardiolipin synthase-like enzyme
MSAAKLNAFEREVVAGLSDKAALASALLEAWAKLPIEASPTPRNLIDAAQLGLTEEGATKTLLERAVSLGFAESVGPGFRVAVSARPLLERLAFALQAIDYYRSHVHRDATQARVVLTKPPQPSVLEQKLSDLGWRTAELEMTEHAFQGMVRLATRRIVVMTPFFDEHGARWLREILSHAKASVERVLILRSLEAPWRKDYPTGYVALESWLRDENVAVHNYSLPRASSSRETFHAKALLCDRSMAYLGSSNVNEASLEHSMEMGVILHGRAAIDVAEVLDAVLRASDKWP